MRPAAQLNDTAGKLNSNCSVCLTRPQAMNKIINELTGPYRRAADTSRLPTHPILGKTALTGYSGVASLSGPEFSTGTTKRLLQFKDPVYPLWYEYAVNSMTAYGITLTYQTDVVAPAGNPVNPYNAQIQDIYTISTSTIANSGDQLGALGVVGNWTGIANTWPMMVDDKLGGAPFIYVPSNFTLNLAAWIATAYVSGGTTTGTMMLEFWVSPGETDTQTLVLGENLAASPSAARKAALMASSSQWVRPISASLTLAGAGTLSASASIYAGLFITPGTPNIAFSTGGNAPQFTAATNSSTAYALLPIPEAMPQQHLTNAILALDNVMMHSSHVSIENMTKILNKEGLISAARLNVAVANPWIATSSAFTGVDPVKRFTRAAEHGITAYVDPTAEYDHTRSHRMFYNYKDNGTSSSLVVMQIRLSDCFNLITITDSDTTTIGSFLLRYAAGWEFITTSTLYETSVVDLRRTPLSLADTAMNLLATRCPFRSYEGERQQSTLSYGNRPRRSPQQRKPPNLRRKPKVKQQTKPPVQSNKPATKPSNRAAPQQQGWGGRGRPANYNSR